MRAALQAVTIPGEENPLPAAAIAEAARSVGIAARRRRLGRGGACATIAGQRGKSGRVLICGSLHLAGVVLRENG